MIWVGFIVLVLALIALDMGATKGRQGFMNASTALRWSLFYIGIAVAFGLGVWHFMGAGAASEYFTAYVVEKSLSVDNLFVFSIIFTYLNIPRKYQHRVLFWGIFGALVMRALMIWGGTTIVSQFDWVLYLFGAFLVFTGIQLFRAGDDDPVDVGNSRTYRWLVNHLPVTTQVHGGKFLVRPYTPEYVRHIHGLGEEGKAKYSKSWKVTPLFLALVLVEVMDVVFAVDSVPAVLSISRDPFIIYTSNVFAILGLRTMYFLLAAGLDRFHYLQPALAVILTFIGTKMLVAHWYHIPSTVSLGVVLGLLAGAALASAATGRRK